MKGLKGNYKLYMQFNKRFLITYTSVSYTLILILFLISQKDPGVDAAFVFAYHIATSVVILWVTFRKVHLQFYYNIVGRTWWPLIISFTVAIIIPLIPSFIYTGMMYYKYDGKFDFDFALQSIGVGIVAIPIMLYSVVIILERMYKMYKTNNQILTGIGILVFFGSFGIVNLFTENESVRNLFGIVFVSIAFVILPLYLAFIGYRKVGA